MNTTTTMNTGAASLSDEQKRAAITACALMIKGICLTTPNAEWTERIENRIHYLLRQIATTPQADADFKNFHRLLCERFGYEHDERDWRRDQLSLIEHIASRATIAAGGAQEAIYQVMVGEKWVDSTAAEYAAVSNEKRIVYAAPLHRVAATVPFQQRVQPWMMECFGPVIADDRMERNHRFFEEATELVQACGMTASEAHQLVDYTFSRPVGEPSQEVGGVMVTLAALCLANRLDMHDSGETELARINVPETVAKIRAKQAAKPKHSPLPAGPAASNGEQA